MTLLVRIRKYLWLCAFFSLFSITAQEADSTLVRLKKEIREGVKRTHDTTTEGINAPWKMEKLSQLEGSCVAWKGTLKLVDQLLVDSMCVSARSSLRTIEV